MKVAVAGAAGRMGKLIVQNVVADSDTELSQAFDIQKIGEDAGEVAGVGRTGVEIRDALKIGKELEADVLIDFTNADASLENIQAASSNGVAVVVGTTGFSEEQKNEISKLCRSIPAVISPNFSIGVNVFWKIIEFSTRYLADYDIEIIEKHHKFKKDAPSGTAIRAAEVALKVLREKGFDRKAVFERSKERKDDELTVLAIRGGDIVGEHTVFYIGMGERIEISHFANSRHAFAGGAIVAAKWIAGKEPGLYSMNDVLGL
jgi:4-hydroxy-tetrahydrodipicolinate reductase